MKLVLRFTDGLEGRGGAIGVNCDRMWDDLHVTSHGQVVVVDGAIVGEASTAGGTKSGDHMATLCVQGGGGLAVVCCKRFSVFLLAREKRVAGRVS